MNGVTDRGLVASVPSSHALSMVERLIGFATVSRDSNLGLIEFARDYLEHLGGVTRLSEEMKRTDPETWIDLDWTNSSGALDVSEENALVQLTMKFARNSTVSKVSYGTEAGLFQAAGIPSVICGPGNIEQAHRPNEFVSLERLAQCERFMVRLADSTVI